jgi:hypothetical protein
VHGIDVARLVYIHRIRKQLAKAFKNLAEGDLLKARPSLLRAPCDAQALQRCDGLSKDGRDAGLSAA